MIDIQIQEIEAKRLIGISGKGSISNDITLQVFKDFMPRKREIEGVKNSLTYSVQLFDTDLNRNPINPNTTFTRIAAVEVSEDSVAPQGMEVFEIPAGLYLTFTHKGTLDRFIQNLQFIYEKWIPDSAYEVDQRPHFEVLGSKYLGLDNPNSEEDIWIPIRLKS